MKNRFQLKIPVMGVLLILVLCVSATAGIGYSNLDNAMNKSSVYSILSDLLYAGPDLAQDTEDLKSPQPRSIPEPVMLMLFGFGLVGLSFIGRTKTPR